MKPVITDAGLDDIETLVQMMNHAHEEAGFRLDIKSAKSAFAKIINDRKRGAAWIARCNRTPLGYIVLTFKFAMESGSTDAFIDDIFVEPPFRRRGIGSALILKAVGEARRNGVGALHVETGADDNQAQAFYLKCGLQNRARTILTATISENQLARRI